LLSTAKLFYTQNDHAMHLLNPMSLEFDSLKVFNILGQEVQSGKIQDASNHVVIPVNNLPSGTYLVKVKGSQGEIQSKFIIP
jgi:hypothetical protein